MLRSRSSTIINHEITLTENDFGGEIIKKLDKAYKRTRPRIKNFIFSFLRKNRNNRGVILKDSSDPPASPTEKSTRDMSP